MRGDEWFYDDVAYVYENGLMNGTSETTFSHILRMQQGNCSIEAGFVWSDLLTNLERTSDHCSNIAGCIIDTAQHNLNLHETLRATKLTSESFREKFTQYAHKYSLPNSAEA